MNVINLIHFRNLRKMTCKDLSLKAGLSSTAVYNIENFRAEPTVERMELLAKALNISPTWLIHSPTLINVKSVLNLLGDIYTYTGGFKINTDGVIVMKSPYNSFLLDIKAKKNEKKDGNISEDEYREWCFNVLPYKPSLSIKKESDIVTKNIWKFAEEHTLSDYAIGIALGADDITAGDAGALFRLGERQLKPKQIQSFIKTFELHYSMLSNDFSIENESDLNHAFLALGESNFGKFLLSNSGAIKFENEQITKALLASNKPPFKE